MGPPPYASSGVGQQQSQLPAPTSVHSPIDYSKWDTLEDSSDEESPPQTAQKASVPISGHHPLSRFHIESDSSSSEDDDERDPETYSGGCQTARSSREPVHGDMPSQETSQGSATASIKEKPLTTGNSENSDSYKDGLSRRAQQQATSQEKGHGTIDYSKWDNLDLSSDDEEDAPQVAHQKASFPPNESAGADDDEYENLIKMAEPKGDKKGLVPMYLHLSEEDFASGVPKSSKIFRDGDLGDNAELAAAAQRMLKDKNSKEEYQQDNLHGMKLHTMRRANADDLRRFVKK